MATAAQLAPPWMPPALIDAWFNEYLDAGGADVPGAAVAAANMIRQDQQYRSLYDHFFPGNRRDDGSLRLSETNYRSRIDTYEDVLLGVGVNPDAFDQMFPGLISGDVGEAEFTQRVESMYERVIEAAPSIREYYAANYALDMTDAAIIASFLDPDVGNAILNRTMAISEIGGEASSRGFRVNLDLATRLEQAGVTQDQAQDLFGAAAMDVPALNVLAARHADPDDDFDINEFTQAAIFDDPVQRRRMRRMVAQERATFSDIGATYGRNRQGLITGLTVQP